MGESAAVHECGARKDTITGRPVFLRNTHALSRCRTVERVWLHSGARADTAAHLLFNVVAQVVPLGAAIAGVRVLTVPDPALSLVSERRHILHALGKEVPLAGGQQHSPLLL